MILQARGDDLGFPVWIQSTQSKENHSTGYLFPPKDELTEILVRGNQESLCVTGILQYGFIVDTGVKLSDVDHVVAIPTQTIDDLPIDTLVGDDPHAASSGMG